MTPVSNTSSSVSQINEQGGLTDGLADGLNDGLIDNIAIHPTPEGLLLSFAPAGLFPRVSAWLIDFLIKAVLMAVVSIAGSFLGFFLGSGAMGLIAISIFLINWLYPVYFEVWRDGMTPGKKSKGIYVCHDDGTPITLSSSMIRNLLRVADFLPIGYLTGVLCLLFHKKSQRLGDMVAGTMVVYAKQDEVATLFRKVYGISNSQSFSQQMQGVNQRLANLPPQLAHTVTQVPLFGYVLHLQEQQALLSFAERAPYLSQARQYEIVNHLRPLLTSANVQYPSSVPNGGGDVSSGLAAAQNLSEASHEARLNEVRLLSVFKRIEQIIGSQTSTQTGTQKQSDAFADRRSKHPSSQGQL